MVGDVEEHVGTTFSMDCNVFLCVNDLLAPLLVPLCLAPMLPNQQAPLARERMNEVVKNEKIQSFGSSI